MTDKKIKEISQALSGLSYREWTELSQRIEAAYVEIKKRLTPEEIKSLAKNVH